MFYLKIDFFKTEKTFYIKVSVGRKICDLIEFVPKDLGKKALM